MLFKLILLAQCTVAGAYGFIELIFIDNMNLLFKLACMIACAAMYHWGCKGFKKNWSCFYEEEEVVKVRRRERMAA